MNYWVIKSEPQVYAFAELQKDKKTLWTGVRNYQARNNLRAMKKGDLLLYFHTGDEKAAVGVAKAAGAATVDPTAKDGDWAAIEVRPLKALPAPVPLSRLKATRTLAGMALVTNSRLSVSPATKAEFQAVLKLGGTAL